jgi:hypothetical protein
MDTTIPATEAKAAMLCAWIEALRAKVDWLTGEVRTKLYSRENLRALKKLRCNLEDTYLTSKNLNREVCTWPQRRVLADTLSCQTAQPALTRHSMQRLKAPLGKPRVQSLQCQLGGCAPCQSALVCRAAPPVENSTARSSACHADERQPEEVQCHGTGFPQASVRVGAAEQDSEAEADSS